MASKFGKSVDEGSDFEYDFYCTSCAEVNSNSEAMFYCGKCLKHYCSTCEKPHGQLFRGHVILDRSKLEQWGSADKDNSKEFCKRHPDKEAELYCEGHDQILCPVCVSVDHRYCQAVNHIPDVAMGIRKTTEFKTLIDDLVAMKATLGSLVIVLTKRNTSINDSGKNIKTTIQSIRKRLNQLLDGIEQGTLSAVDVAVGQLTADNQADLDAYNDLYKDVDKLVNDLQTSGKSSDKRAFVGYKKGVAILTKCEETRNRTMGGSRVIKLAEDKQIEQVLSSVKLLGTVDLEQVVSLSESKNFNVKAPDDHLTPRIADIYQLYDGQWIVTDNQNDNYKLLDRSFNVMNVLQMRGGVKSVCQVWEPEGTIYATVYQGRLNVLKVIYRKLTHVKTQVIQHVCGPIVIRNDKMYISSYTELYQHTLDGKLVSKVYGRKRTNSVYRFALSSDDKWIYISSLNEHVVTMIDQQGNVLRRFSDPDLRGPSGLCVLLSGHVLVCGRDSNNILQLDGEAHKKTGVVVSNSQYLRGPVSIRFDSKTRKLVVAKGNSCDILVFHIQ